MAKARSEHELSHLCSFDYVFGQVLHPFFTSLDDSRAFNVSYSLGDALRAAFAIYSLKVASLFQFQRLAQAEEHNLATIFRVGRIPSDNGLRKLLDGVRPEELRAGFGRLLDHLRGAGLLRRYFVWRDYVAVSIDGVEHFNSKRVECPQCLHRKHRDGTIDHYHAMLSAALVQPGVAEVFPLDHEPIIGRDGRGKNDCERSAVHRLLDHFQVAYPELKTVFVLDALYACGPVIQRLERVSHWRYVIGVKPGSHVFLFEQFDELEAQGNIQWREWTEGRTKVTVGYANKLSLNQGGTDLSTNLLYAICRDSRGKDTVFTFVTNVGLTKDNVERMLAIGRARWKIENETFNTLKNQGYHFEHNFGHGEKNLCTVMAYLMMMAFWLDQLQQAANQTFRTLLGSLKTRVKLWDSLRTVFRMVPAKTMEEIHIRIADMYCIRLI